MILRVADVMLLISQLTRNLPGPPLPTLSMDTREFGILAMIAFWASAAGGIAIAISWARFRGKKRSREAGDKDGKDVG